MMVSGGLLERDGVTETAAVLVGRAGGVLLVVAAATLRHHGEPNPALGDRSPAWARKPGSGAAAGLCLPGTHLPPGGEN
jgi:hypothetical protein